MFNMDSSNFEPRVKELLLERRHSICLEVSKKRRQSVASSIFIPKESPQIEQRLRSTSIPENESTTTSKNKRNPDLEKINRKNIRCLIKRMKLKHMPCEAKNNRKNIAKRQQILKHPSSYPIVKQAFSSKNLRCVVESLRESFDSKVNAETSILPIQANYTDDDNCLNPTQNPNKNLPIEIEKESSPVIDNEMQTLKPLTNDSADNFIIIMDATGDQFEIKYAKQPSPFPNDYVEGEKKADEHPSYAETNNRTTLFKTQIKIPTNQSNICCTNIGGNIKRIDLFGDKISKLNYLQKNQEEIIDLSLKDNKARTPSLSSTCCYNLSNQNLMSTSSQKGLTCIQKSSPIFEHHHHYIMQQEHAHLEPHYLQLHSRNKNILESKALHESYLPNCMPSEMCSSSSKNEFCPVARRFRNQIAFKLDSKTQIQQSEMINYFPNQLYENYLKPEIYDFPTSPYNQIQQQQQLDYALQSPQTCNICNLDLPQPLHHPLHQNLHYFPAQYRSKNFSTGLGPFVTEQLCDVANAIPQFMFAETNPTYLTPTPPIPEYLNPTNFPFPSPHSSNTLKKCVTPIEILPSYLNISSHLYQPEFSTKTELLTDVHTATCVPCPNTTLAERMLNNFCRIPKLHVNTHSPHLRRDHI